MTSQPIKQRVSLTLDPHVIATFKEIALKSNVSLSSLINDWLESTGPALVEITHQLLEVKTRPAKVLNDLLLFQEKNQENLNSVRGELRALLDRMPQEEGEGPEPVIGKDVEITRKADFTPHSNTGVKLPLSSKKGP